MALEVSPLVAERIAALDPEGKEKALGLLKRLEQAQRTNRIESYKPYPWQADMHAAGGSYPERMARAANQTGKCITINSLVSTPNGDVAVRDLLGKGRFRVLSWDGEEVVETEAMPIFKKAGFHQCYRLVCRDGSWIEVANEHGVFLDGGWLRVRQLLESLPALPVSNSDNSRSTRDVDDLRLSGMPSGSPGGCLGDRHSGDGQPLTFSGSGQASLPSPSDALPRAWPWSRLGGLVDRCTSTLRLGFGHLSNPDALLPSAALCVEFSTLGASRSAPPWFDSSQKLQRSSTVEASPPRSCGGSSLRSPASQIQPLPRRSPFMSANDIIGYEPIGCQEVYDFHVPEHWNYLAGGLINHNTFSGAAETTYHATGEYPDWWQGKRFDRERNLVIWVGSKTGASSRDIVQAELFGDVESGDDIGTGTIPRRCIEGKPKFRQSSVSNVLDYAWVRRKNGSRCKIQFLQYEMGWQKWQGKRVHFIWLDEEPSRGDFPTDEDYKIFTECQTRIAVNEGCLLVTFTPLSGRTPLVDHFDQDPPIPGTMMFTASWNDAPHLSDERKDQLKASYPAHEIAARTSGVPMVGSGLVWTVPEERIIINDFPVPNHFAQIIGTDFGINHPAASARCAYDRDNGIFYVIAGYKIRDQMPAYHAARFNEWGRWIPVSWPHDGHKRSEGSGGKLIEIRHQYHKAGANMLAKSARYAPKPDPRTGKTVDNGGNQPVEPITMELGDDMLSGRFRVFRSCSELFFEEMRQFHRNSTNGAIVDRNDDFIKATMYAKMMARYAVPATLRHRGPVQVQPMQAMRLR